MRRVALTALGLWMMFVAPAAARDCDRTCTLQIADAVLTAMQTGQTGKLLPRNLRLTENGRDIRLADSQLRAFKRVTFVRTFAEPLGGAAGINGAAEAYGGPAVFAVRLKLKNGQVSEIETLVVRRTEAPVFAPQSMTENPESDQVLVPGQRMPRTDMIAVAEGYMNRLPQPDSGLGTAGPDCAITENGARSPPATGCLRVVGLGGTSLVRDRRWPLVDEERGLVWGWAVADLPNGAVPVSGQPPLRAQQRAPHSVLTGALLRMAAGRIVDVDMVLRDVPLGAVTGWALPKAKKVR